MNPRYHADPVPSDCEFYRSSERALGTNELPPCGTPLTHRLLHARVLRLFFVSCAWVWLGHGTGILLCQIPDTVPHATEKTKYPTVPYGTVPFRRGKRTEYRLPKCREIYIPYRTAPHRTVLSVCGIPLPDTIQRKSFPV